MELHFVYGTAAVIVGYFALEVLRRRFDPFAPIWLFLVGYAQLYVIQPIMYREWALQIRGVDLVTTAGVRAFWTLLLMLGVYECGIGRMLSGLLPQPPRAWSAAPVAAVAPLLIAWGVICSGLVLRAGAADGTISAEEALFRSFAFVMLVGGILLVVTGRSGAQPRPWLTAAGLIVGAAYVLIWMFNGKRSHSLMGVLCTVCAFYITRRRRPSWPVLVATAIAGTLVVALAIGWRGNMNYERSFAGFARYVTEFEPARILVSLNLGGDEVPGEYVSRETEEYGGFLLMLDAVPGKSGYDYGVNYLRLFSTYIPRILWPNKPLFGREQWIGAWIASSELKRDTSFTGPSIGLLGATHLNGGAAGTAIVVTCLAVLLSTAYGYFRRHDAAPWVQAWWALTFINAWFMVVGDDPFVWFYYNYGFTTLPPLFLFWVANALAAPAGARLLPGAEGPLAAAG